MSSIRPAVVDKTTCKLFNYCTAVSKHSYASYARMKHNPEVSRTETMDIDFAKLSFNQLSWDGLLSSEGK